MAAEGIRFERFYSGAPGLFADEGGCCLTGRHPYRYGILGANVGHMKPEEITLAELLREQGYATGHFGKWHVGTLTTAMKDSNRGRPGDPSHYAPPWENGFEACFSTEAKVPTWNPMRVPKEGLGAPAGSKRKETWRSVRYAILDWSGTIRNGESRGRRFTDHHGPGDSLHREGAVKDKRPFFAVIWFHAPHLPAVGGGRYLEMYSKEDSDRRHYYACISAMDAQLCRLRHTLRRLGAHENTMLWFCSDNGPEGKATAPGRTAGLRGRKRSLYEGGVRVPGILVWPARVKKPRLVTTPCVTADYFPTVLDAAGLEPVEDGRSAIRRSQPASHY